MYEHSGIVGGSVATAHLIPKSHLAVVAFSNAADGETAETASQILVQTLFDLKPAVDLLPCVKAYVTKRRQMHDDVVKDWREHKTMALYHATPEELQGAYLGSNVSRIHVLPSDSAVSGLAVTFIYAAEIQCHLEPYNEDSLSFHPLDYYDRRERGMLDWHFWTVGILLSCEVTSKMTSERQAILRAGRGLLLGLDGSMMSMMSRVFG